jgi:hypothetical protein
MVSVIVAQGFMGRTTISCDQGKTWINNRSFDLEGGEMMCGDSTPVICGQTACKKKAMDGTCYVENPCECGHEQGWPKGVAIANNAIVANFGWGNPGVTLRSLDGISFGDPFYHKENYIGLAFGFGKFVHFGLDTLYSANGYEWESGPETYRPYGPDGNWITPRVFTYLDYQEGRFVAGIDSGLIRVSKDGGQTWVSATSSPPDCLNGMGNSRLITGNGIVVHINADGKACRSSDGGMNWTIHDIKGGNLYVQGGGVFANGNFMVWGSGADGLGVRYHSPDGVNWTATHLANQLYLGAVGVSPEGTLIATGWFWSAYTGQVFLRSTDNGLTWTQADRFVQSHMIWSFTSGKMPAGTACPAP